MSGDRRSRRRTDGQGAQLVTVVLTYEQARALTRCVVRYLSLPEAPLIPAQEEARVLEAYDLLVGATVPEIMALGDDDGTTARP